MNNTKMLDIRQALIANNNRLLLMNTRLGYSGDGIVISGILPLQISNDRYIRLPTHIMIEEGAPLQRANAWLGAVYTKNSGYGYPNEIEVVFDEEGNIVDLIGELSTFGFEASGRPCLLCGGNPCECPKGNL